MAPLSFARRVFLLIGVMLFVCSVTSLFITWWWIGTVIALGLQLMTAALIGKSIIRHVQSEHTDFLSVIRNQQKHLPTGQRGQALKSFRPNDSFGEIAAELNQLGDVVSSEMTRQINANQELRQSNALSQSVLGTMIEGVLVLDSERRVLYFNDAARKMLDCQSRSFGGRPVWEVVREPELEQIVDAAFEANCKLRRELELQRIKSIIEITVTQLPLTPKPGVVLVLHDVTEVRRLERMRREFVSNVSHELKTPLTSIQVYADTLLDGGFEDAEHSQLFLSRIIDQTDRLQQLIRDMLHLARIESHSEAFQFQPIDVHQSLQDSVQQHQPVAISRNISLTFTGGSAANPNGTGTRPRIWADQTGFRTIIDNLVVNAINYNRDGGKVDVHAEVSGKNLIITVEDNGIGIAAEHQSRIFERFYRVDRARTATNGSTGLGLAIVKHLAIVFHGDIRVESEIGKGTRFILTLPLYEEPNRLTSSDHE